MNDAQYWIETLNLTKHPEGGFYKRIYCSSLSYKTNFSTSIEDDGKRNLMSSIYYLIEYGDFSAFHRLKADEVWHFYAGNDLTIYQIQEDEELVTSFLGNPLKNQKAVFQYPIYANRWFSVGLSDEENKDAYALVGCTISPEFNFRDFELGDKKELIKQYPQHAKLINKFTR